MAPAKTFGRNAAFWGVAGQVLQSLVNFLTGIILITYATKEEFGHYGIVMATMLIVIGVSNALITTQMTVRTPKKTRPKDYLGAMLILQIVVVTPLITLIAAGGYWTYRQTGSNLAQLLLLMPVYLLPLLALEFSRRALFIERNLRAAFVMDSLYAAAYLLPLYAAAVQGESSLNLRALLISGASAAACTLLFLLTSRLPLRHRWPVVRDCFMESWGQGRWALGGVALTWIQNQGYVYILAFFAGATAVAEINAVRLLLAPVAVISAGIGKVLLPRLAHHWHRAQQLAIDSLVLRTLLIYLAMVVAYTTIFFLFADSILAWLPDHYRFSLLVFVSWAGFFLFQGGRNIASLMMQVSLNFRPLTLRSAVVATFSLVILIFVVPVLGPEITVSVMAAAEALLGLLLWQFYLQRIRPC